MPESTKNISKKAGLPPGVLVHIGQKLADSVRISIIDYTATDYFEKICKDTEEVFEYKDKKSVTWINIDGLHDVETIGKIGEFFNLHPLLIEDVLNTKHRPKLEEYEECLFLTFKALNVDEENDRINSEQMSFVLGPNYLISFQEREGDIFDGLRQRIKENKGTIREKSVDYLLYRLVDTVVDNYFLITEYVSDATIELEERVFEDPDDEALFEIHDLKKQLVGLRKATGPLREAVLGLHKGGNKLIKESTERYLQDVYEHIIQANETIESQRDTVASIMDLYMTGVSNRMNQVMQVLTIIATIFIPLTFLAGIYGMNFDNMPELHWKYGYFMVWGIMTVITTIMIFYFRRKKWL